MATANNKLYRSGNGHVWVGEHWVGRYPAQAVQTADVPAAEDPRWIPGVPRTLDVEFLTLSPFSPNGRLGVCVERKSSKPLGQYPNHPPFAGCQAWMDVGALDWQPVPVSPGAAAGLASS